MDGLAGGRRPGTASDGAASDGQSVDPAAGDLQQRLRNAIPSDANQPPVVAPAEEPVAIGAQVQHSAVMGSDGRGSDGRGSDGRGGDGQRLAAAHRNDPNRAVAEADRKPLALAVEGDPGRGRVQREQGRGAGYAAHDANPSRNAAPSSLRPMKTSRLHGFSPSRQGSGSPRSISMCTPCTTIFRSPPPTATIPL